jgi:uncharacterized membrane protein
MLWLGVIIWSVVHAVPGLAPGLRASLAARLGENGYKIAFTAAMLLSLLLIVLGWRATTPEIVYEPPVWGRHLAMLLVLIAFLLFAFSHGKSNLKRFVRHPQLTAVIVWAIGHLLANGDSRSVVLFGVLGVWALAEIVIINRRDQAWTPPAPRPLSAEIKPVVIGVVLYAVFILIHPYLFGVSPIGV